MNSYDVYVQLVDAGWCGGDSEACIRMARLAVIWDAADRV